MCYRLKIGKATSIRKEGVFTIVQLYDTDIVKFDEDNLILNSGGFKTATTKKRINEIIGSLGHSEAVTVVQKANEWFIKWSNSHIEPFKDNMIISRGCLGKE